MNRGTPFSMKNSQKKLVQGGALDATKKLGESEQPWPLAFFEKKEILLVVLRWCLCFPGRQAKGAFRRLSR